MATVTKQKALIAYFVNSAFSTRDNNARSSKYVVFRSDKTDRNYYIGKAGAVRHGKTIKASIPMNTKIVAEMVKEGTRMLERDLLT